MSLEEEIKNALTQLELPVNEMDHSVQQIVQVRKRLTPIMEQFAQKKLSRSLAISQDFHAVNLMDRLTDMIIESRGVLAMAMQGQDIHDLLATIKAKLMSLISGEEQEPLTVQKLQTATQKIAKIQKDQK